ncbi:hypothetical protein V6N11_022328 [Hibiscus sabdariffa]|uniref:Uncharacterized protein n=1 Tax=Hibiscus sabdariffa TaxID=183260 RepID=A0ABR2TJL7_9ROSI
MALQQGGLRSESGSSQALGDVEVEARSHQPQQVVRSNANSGIVGYPSCQLPGFYSPSLPLQPADNSKVLGTGFPTTETVNSGLQSSSSTHVSFVATTTPWPTVQDNVCVVSSPPLISQDISLLLVSSLQHSSTNSGSDGLVQQRDVGIPTNEQHYNPTSVDSHVDVHHNITDSLAELQQHVSHHDTMNGGNDGLLYTPPSNTILQQPAPIFDSTLDQVSVDLSSQPSCSVLPEVASLGSDSNILASGFGHHRSASVPGCEGNFEDLISVPSHEGACLNTDEQLSRLPENVQQSDTLLTDPIERDRVDGVDTERTEKRWRIERDRDVEA